MSILSVLKQNVKPLYNVCRYLPDQKKKKKKNNKDRFNVHLFIGVRQNIIT